MKGDKLDCLVRNCGVLASKGKDVKAYVILYKTKDGSINYHRDGDSDSQVGMLEVAKRGIVNGFFNEVGDE